jgi:hypothetical protein
MSPGGISPNDAGSLSKELVLQPFSGARTSGASKPNETSQSRLLRYGNGRTRAAGLMLWFMRKKFVGSCLLLSAATRSQNLKFAQQRSGSSSLYVAAIAEAHARLGNTDKALGIGSCVRHQPSDMFRRVICRCSTRHREIWMRHSHG